MQSLSKLGITAMLALGVAACGGGSSGGTDAGDEQTTVTTASCTAESTDPACQSESENTGSDTGDTPPVAVAPEVLPVGGVRAGSVAADNFDLYLVPSDAQVILTTTSGDADLFLYTSDDFSDETFLCAARRPFIEDTCSGTDPDGEVYAVVYGRETSSYSVSVSNDCSVAAVNEWVYRNMQDYYLFADEVPVLDPAAYESTNALMSALRFSERDPYSGVSNATSRQQFFDEGILFGFGFNERRDSDGNLRVIYTYTDGPFGRAGIKRGDILVGINDELWDDIDRERYFELIGTVDAPQPNVWRYIDGETGEGKSVILTASEYVVNSVLHSEVYTSTGFDGRTGYIVFNEFIRESEAELDAVITDFISRGVTELVLDLRYNQGGYTFIAEKLASQIGGQDLADNVLTSWEYNSQYTSSNYVDRFAAETPALDFDRVVVLTTGQSASASELVINSLSPFIDVVVVGQKTEGKAFSSTSKVFCGVALNAMENEGFNANGVSVSGGVTPNCYAADDITRNFGGTSSSIEGMLLSALDYVVFGRCDVNPVFTKQPEEITRIDERPVMGAIADPASVKHSDFLTQ